MGCTSPVLVGDAEGSFVLPFDTMVLCVGESADGFFHFLSLLAPEFRELFSFWNLPSFEAVRVLVPHQPILLLLVFLFVV
jgi:hypothetical protein